jgi:hypothetical protein
VSAWRLVCKDHVATVPVDGSATTNDNSRGQEAIDPGEGIESDEKTARLTDAPDV